MHILYDSSLDMGFLDYGIQIPIRDRRCAQAELIKTYELIDENGHLRRYNPEEASRPLSELFSTIRTQVWGTYLSCRLALTHDVPGLPEFADNPGFCFYLGGGMHHARRDSGSGFCLLNDIVIAARRLQSEGLISSIWIIDVDAHKGDGTAELTYGDRSIPSAWLMAGGYGDRAWEPPAHFLKGVLDIF
jgi:acetoin utilization deacetylase AcuC-like enzyme